MCHFFLSSFFTENTTPVSRLLRQTGLGTGGEDRHGGLEQRGDQDRAPRQGGGAEEGWMDQDLPRPRHLGCSWVNSWVIKQGTVEGGGGGRTFLGPDTWDVHG